MDRNNQKIFRGARSRDSREELRSRKRDHSGKFSVSLHSGTSPKKCSRFAVRSAGGSGRSAGDAENNPPSAAKITYNIEQGTARSTFCGSRTSYSAPIRRMSRNSVAVTGITDKRDCRTSCIFFNFGSSLISRSETGRRKRLTGIRSTALQSPSLAVGSA